MSEIAVPPHWVRGDFNGLFGDLLCLSHDDTATRASGEVVTLATGMALIAFEHDWDEDQPSALILRGRVEPSPDELACRGSRWCLRGDERGLLRWVELDEATRAELSR
jgi:hypothetical protein